MSLTILFLTSLNITPEGVFKYSKMSERQFREAYVELVARLNEANFRVYFADIAHLSPEGAVTSAFLLKKDNGESLEFEEAARMPFPDIVVNRRKDEFYQHPAYQKIARSAVILNDLQTATLGNKEISYTKLKDFFPRTILIGRETTNRQATIRRALQQFGTIVIKPVRENGGKGIVISDKPHAISEAIDDRQPYILQEFIETKQGIAGITNSRHDIRLYVIGGAIVAGSVRTPKGDELLSNTALGGNISFLPVASLPPSLLVFAGNLLSRLNLPETSFISIDFFYGNQKWYLIEINDQPGIPATYQHKEVANAIHIALIAMYTKATTS